MSREHPGPEFDVAGLRPPQAGPKMFRGLPLGQTPFPGGVVGLAQHRSGEGGGRIGVRIGHGHSGAIVVPVSMVRAPETRRVVATGKCGRPLGRASPRTCGPRSGRGSMGAVRPPRAGPGLAAGMGPAAILPDWPPENFPRDVQSFAGPGPSDWRPRANHARLVGQDPLHGCPGGHRFPINFRFSRYTGYPVARRPGAFVSPSRREAGTASDNRAVRPSRPHNCRAASAAGALRRVACLTRAAAVAPADREGRARQPPR